MSRTKYSGQWLPLWLRSQLNIQASGSILWLCLELNLQVSGSPLLMFTIYHQGFFHSVRRNPSLNCFHRRRSLPIIGHAGPRWRIRLSLHLVLGLPCRLVHYRGVHSVTLLVNLLSLNRAMCPAHPCIPFLITSMMSFTPV